MGTLCVISQYWGLDIAYACPPLFFLAFGTSRSLAKLNNGFSGLFNGGKTATECFCMGL